MSGKSFLEAILDGNIYICFCNFQKLTFSPHRERLSPCGHLPWGLFSLEGPSSASPLSAQVRADPLGLEHVQPEIRMKHF